LNRRRFLAAAAILPLAGRSSAQGFPRATIRLLVPFGAGTGSDLVARSFAPVVGESLGQPVVVENREGAGGVVGTTAVARAAADGHTLLLAANPFCVAANLYDVPPFDPLRDFAPIALLGSVPNVLVVHPALPVRNVAELLTRTRAKPGTLFYASSGKGTPSQLEVERLKQELQLDIIEVPYKSTALAMTDLVAGRVALYYPTLPAALPHIKAGRLRALAVGSAQRLPSLPEVPSMAEALGPGHEAQTWYGVVAPAATPREIQDRLSAAFLYATQRADVVDRLRATGTDLTPQSAEHFGALLAREVVKWRNLVARLGLRAD